ncbi:unnamed protein product [Chrysoparadoxa australica]
MPPAGSLESSPASSVASVELLFLREEEGRKGGEAEAEEEEDCSELIVVTSPLLVAGEGSVRVRGDKKRGIAFQLWPAASFLCSHLEAHPGLLQELCPQKDLSAMRVCELGAGVGLVGLFIAAMGAAETLLTDLPSVIDQLEENIALNPAVASKVAAVPLSWGSSDWEAVAAGGCDIVVCADCVYWEELFEPLKETLINLTQAGAVVLMAHMSRWKKDMRFFRSCGHKMTVVKLHEEVSRTTDPETKREERQVLRLYSMSKKEAT